MIKRLALFSLLIIMGFSSSVLSHCEIPCGIYGDKMRFDMWMEQIQTVEKSMNQIMELSKAGDKNYNQIVRWVTNKDVHADDIREIAVQYFLAQRVKPLTEDADAAAKQKYADQLKTLHLIIVHAMKSKQTTDLQHVEKLRDLVQQFYELYFDKEMEKHMEGHH
ncbi:superoxide dismutase [candidate division KSB1 bacterium]|nr:superoxide dismutase [candidate division KSB1 bacterium]